MTTLSLPTGYGAVIAQDRTMLFASCVGFFFVFRVAITFLFFQANPVTGTVAIISLDLALLYGAVLYSAQDRTSNCDAVLVTPPIRWLFAFLSLSLASMLWTEAKSIVAAIAYWSAMAADVVIVLLLLRRDTPEDGANALMKGAVWGAIGLSLIAWCSPATGDLRLGDDIFLHPNTLGLEIGIGTLFAQHLALPGRCIGSG